MIMDFPAKINSVLPESLFCKVNEEVASIETEYVFNNGSLQRSSRFLGQLNRWDRIIYYKAATHTLLKVKRVLQKDIILAKMHSGGKLFGSQPEFHTDFDEDYLYTFVLFTNLHWNTNWGGEFVARDPHTEEYKYVPYIPNNGVLVPSNWEHTGNPPISVDAGLRTSVAFMYCETDRYDEFLLKYPAYRLYS